MGFLSSIYLWLIPLTTLPLLIHLFFNRRYNLIEFSTIKFLKDLEIDSMKRVQIIEILLLIIRTLIILALILMLSRPIMKSQSFESYFESNKSIDCIIALDDSFSMTRSDNVQYIKDIYGSKIKDIVETLPEKSHLSIIKLSNEKLIFDGFRNEYNQDALIGRMEHGNINFKSFISSFHNKDKSINNELHILSDLQEYSFLTLDNKSLDGWNVFIHEINNINNNLSIILVDIREDIITINQEIQIDVSIQNNGQENARNALLILSIDNLNVGQQQINLDPGETTTYSFFTVLNTPGNHASTIELVHDDFDADNTYLFNLDIPENINVGLLGDSNDDLLFLENSLKAFNYNYKNITIRYPNEILMNENLLVGNDVTFICGYNYIIDNNLESSITDALNNGSSIFIFPSTNDRVDNIKTSFFDFISFDYTELDFNEYDNERSIQLSSKNLINDDLIDIFGGPNNQSDFKYMKLYKFFDFPSDKKSNIVIEGMSIWNTYSIYNGKVNIVGFIPRLEWTDFPIKASFISWVNYCLTENLNNLNLIYEIGDKYINSSSESTIISPDSKRYKQRSNTEDLFKFSVRGIHVVEGADFIQKIFVNPSINELKFNRIENKKLKELFANPLILAKNSKIDEKIKMARVGIELWKYFLYLSIILIIIEMVISNQFFRKD